MGEAKACQDFGGARGRRMGADVGQTGLDFGDSVRIAGGPCVTRIAASWPSGTMAFPAPTSTSLPIARGSLRKSRG